MTSDTAMRPTHSLIIPVYRNEEFLPETLRAVRDIAQQTSGPMEVVFVIDGSPDRSEQWLLENLQGFPVPAQLIALSRNFGSFTAIRVGLAAAQGDYMAVMAADLQEPPSLIVDFFRALAEGHDVAVGTRLSREDPWFSKTSARAFWRLYRILVEPAIPKSGVDTFAVSRRARDALLALDEAHSSLVAQLFWIGFPRAEVPYERRARTHGTSGWTFRRKVTYLLDSIFSFTDIPITIVTAIGFIGTISFLLLGIALLVARVLQLVSVPGYTAIMVTILFSASLILFGLGIVGNYVWRAYENTKQRPLGIVRGRRAFPGTQGTPETKLD
jgi:glycosyltransferase involved in cell wall biosynthesis